MKATDSKQNITTQADLEAFCRRAAKSSFIGFDTEFVSENCYRPELCLVQAATENETAIIDVLTISKLDPFWELLTQGDHITITHAAREEFLFCYRAIGRRPKNLFDIQLAAGMIGYEYPAAYSNLVSRVLGHSVDKGETRTDWSKRPLSAAQLSYALQDVIHLKPIYDTISSELNRMNRSQWLREETSTWLQELERAETEPQWQRVNGIAGLSPRALAIVRELWIARDTEAQKKNRSPRRVLPDDLIVELARRGVSDPKSLRAIRGFDSRVSAAITDRLAKAIATANALPEGQLPAKPARSKSIQLGLLGQFLTTALKIVCDREKIAAGVVGTAQDIRDLAAWHMKMVPANPKPLLATGWRAAIIGQTIEDMIDGRIGIRVINPRSDDPLDLIRVNQKENKP
jgi:ribonuclease D